MATGNLLHVSTSQEPIAQIDHVGEARFLHSGHEALAAPTGGAVEQHADSTCRASGAFLTVSAIVVQRSGDVPLLANSGGTHPVASFSLQRVGSGSRRSLALAFQASREGTEKKERVAWRGQVPVVIPGARPTETFS